MQKEKKTFAHGAHDAVIFIDSQKEVAHNLQAQHFEIMEREAQDVKTRRALSSVHNAQEAVSDLCFSVIETLLP
jgi:hypothetical protein